MAKKLTEAQIASYERDGYICPVDAFSTEQARAWRAQLEEFERAEGQKMTRGHNFKPHLLFPWVDEIVHAPAVLDAVEDLIGPDIRLFHLSVWPKDPGSGAYVSWHQDATYFALDPVCHVTAWVALTDAPVEAGCMEVVPGSHKGPMLSLFEGERFTGAVASDEEKQALAKSIPCVGKAGAVCLMHTKLLHGSAANRSDASRGLYICVYTAADAVPIARNPMPSLNEGRIVRGKEARFARLTEGMVELPKQPKSASFFTVQGQASKKAAE